MTSPRVMADPRSSNSRNESDRASSESPVDVFQGNSVAGNGLSPAGTAANGSHNARRAGRLFLRKSYREGSPEFLLPRHPRSATLNPHYSHLGLAITFLRDLPPCARARALAPLEFLESATRLGEIDNGSPTIAFQSILYASFDTRQT